MTIPGTLAEKLLAVLGAAPTNRAAERPVHLTISDFEAHLVDWGVAYGTAYGIACGESPYETEESRAARALDAADQVWARLNRWPERDRVEDDS